MFRYANPYDSVPRVAESDQVLDGINIVLDVMDESDGQDVETGLAFFLSQTPTRDITDIFLLYNRQKYVHKYLRKWR